MPRHKAPAQQVPPKKKRTFFSATKLPALPLARAPSPPRAVSSDRILAALQPDAHVVVAAKNFVKDKMGDDKWEIADKTRVTRGAAAAAVPQPVMKRRGRPPRKAPVAKVQAKVVAVGSTTNVVAQRLKAKTAVVARKITLRTRVPTPPAAAPETVSQEPVAGPSTSRAPPSAPAVAGVPGPSTVVKDSSIQSAPMDQSPNKRKDYMTAGLYCDEEQPTEEGILVNRVLAIRGQTAKRGPGRPRKSTAAAAAPLAAPISRAEEVSFPPLPIDHGNVHFFGTQREFRLPYDIMWESEQGALDGKKRPPAYTKLRSNKYLERPPCPTNEPGECDCEPDEGCTDRCINRIMSYLCGKDCPCGENCGNQSLVRRKGKATKVSWTGDKARGFGLFAAEDIPAGEFVIDYRGEVIHINTFIERIETIYRSRKNYYALAYDGNEVIDAGLRGNDARFINHGCQPNLEVRKMQTIGDGSEEFEIGMWAMRSIKSGEELFYDYNFDSFSIEVKKNQRQKCLCGAPNCTGFLGRKQGERSAKELAAQIEAKAAAAEFYMNESIDEPMSGQSSKGKEVDRSAAPAAADPAAAAPAASSATIAPKRGRPKKAQKVSGATLAPTAPQPIAPAPPAGAAGDAPIAIPPATGEPPKKKRGRPPKPRPEGWQLIKRPRGRPRIHPLPDPAFPIVKRPRGRPRKKPLKGEAGVRGVGIRSNSVADSGSEDEGNAGYSPVAGPSRLGTVMSPAAAAEPSSASPPVAHAAAAPAAKSFYWKSVVPSSSSSSSQAAAAPKAPAESAEDVHMASAQGEPTAPAKEVPKAPAPKVTKAPNAPNPPAQPKAAPPTEPEAAVPAPQAPPSLPPSAPKAADEPSTSNGTAEPPTYASVAGPSRIKLNIGGRDAVAPYPKRSPTRTTAPNGSAEASSSSAPQASAVVKRKPGRPPKKQRGPPSKSAPLVAAAMASEPATPAPPPPPPPTGPKWATAPAAPATAPAPTYAAAVAGHAEPPATPAAVPASSSSSAFAVGASAVPALTGEGAPAKQTPKQLQKAKRNGAPVGWAYEVVPAIPGVDGAGVAPVDATESDDGRRSRRTSRRID